MIFLAFLPANLPSPTEFNLALASEAKPGFCTNILSVNDQNASLPAFSPTLLPTRSNNCLSSNDDSLAYVEITQNVFPASLASFDSSGSIP